MSKKKILFICLGNICRSPLAEGITKVINTEKILDVLLFLQEEAIGMKGKSPVKTPSK